jgi:hypothetical protein
VKTVRCCVLWFLLSTMAGGVSAALSGSGQPPIQTRTSAARAATLPTLDAPFNPRSPNSAPVPSMPVPAATDHYAGPAWLHPA